MSLYLPDWAENKVPLNVLLIEERKEFETIASQLVAEAMGWDKT